MTVRPFALPTDLKSDPLRVLSRAALACARTADQGSAEAETYAKRTWPKDVGAAMLTRAATNVATTTGAGWAAPLALTNIADTLVGLAPQSAAAELLRRSVAVQFDGRGSIMVPSVISSASGASFVGEGLPLPITQLVVGGPTLAPFKFAIGVSLTRQVVDASTPNAEALVRLVLSESIAAALDSALLDANAATAVRPAGLRAGVTATTATAGGTVDALRKDVGLLIDGVSDIAAGQIVLIGAPDVAAKLLLNVGPSFPYPVLSSNGLAAGFLMAVATNALAFAVAPEPRIETSTEAVIHSDDAPSAVSTPGSPNVVAAPLRSLFQTDCVGIKVLLKVSWGVRATGAVAWMQSVTW